MKKTDEKIVKEIVRLYVDEKMPTTKLGKIFNISSTAVSNIIKRSGIDVRGISVAKKGIKRGSMLPVDKIIELYVNKGLSSIKVSEEVGCSKRSVLNVLRENNVEARGSCEYDRSCPISEEIRDQYLSGKSINEVCSSVNMSYSGVRRVLDSFSVIRTSDKHMGSRLGVPMSCETKVKSRKTKLFKKENGDYDHIYLKRTGYTYDEFKKIQPLYYAYKNTIRRITNQQGIVGLPNSGKRGNPGVVGAYNLDHMYSIKEGFLNDVDPEIIGNIANLEFIPWEENLSKNKICSITLEELKNNIDG